MKFTPRRLAKHLLGLLIAWMMPMAFGFGVAHAQYCRFNNSSIYLADSYFGFNSGGKIVIPPNLPDGGVIATLTLEIPYNCQANPGQPGGWEFKFKQWLPQSGIPGVFFSPFSDPSVQHYRYIGIRTTNLDTGEVMMGCCGAGMAPQPWGPPIEQTVPIQGVLRVKKELIKLSDLIYNYPNAAMINLSQYDTELYAFNRNTNQYNALWRSWWHDRGSLGIKPVSCTVLTTNPEVPLPPVAASKLNAVGMTAGDRDFAISLSCKAGTNLCVTLTDLTNPGNMSNELTLTPDATAKGVKLRILRNGQPVSYGPDSPAVGNPNQWYVGPSGSVSSIPLSAQYIAAGVVSGGTVKGAATFTLSYQ
ncbi:type 1 fimbrial protein [Burkholderia cenocepacia]|uniref:fimbrial protein n=1 Tax=Burkholderia cenocepacia TaxID=95486 RepID=UPI001CF48BE7|nr:fimbrial protein [Burkholderia cenocepacia]MCA7925845.1 type 1 fimbrial protein [Burkholderia cenocepacia]